MTTAVETDRYTRRSILRSEQMYGRGFQSPNYLGAMEAFCALAGVRNGRPGVRVLGVGSGLGGGACQGGQLAWGCFTAGRGQK